MNLQDWLEKARGHKYIRKYVGPGGKTYYEYQTPGGQKVSVPSRGAVAAEKEKAKAAAAPKKEPAKPTAAGTETIKEAVEKTAEKIKASVPTDKEVKQVKQEAMAKDEIAKTFGLASQVVKAAIDNRDRGATLKAAKALLAVAKQPGQKGKVLKELRELGKAARAHAKLINGRYNADRYKEPKGRKKWEYDDVLQARSVRDLIDKARDKVSKMKAKNPETTRTPPNPEFPNVIPSSPTKRKAMEDIKPVEPIKEFKGGELVARVSEGKLEGYPSGTKFQWHDDDGNLNEAVKVKAKWHNTVSGKRGTEVRSAEGMAGKIKDAGIKFEGKAPPTLARMAVSVLNLKDGPYENNARLRKHLEAAHVNPRMRSTALDQLAIDAMDYYSDFGSHTERQKLRETAMSSRNENILEGTHVDAEPHTLMHLMVALATNPTGGSGSLNLLVKDSTTATERAEVAKLTHKIKDPQARSMVERILAAKKSDDEYYQEAKEKQEKEAARREAQEKLLKPGDLYPGASAGGNWRVKKATRKTVTIVSGSDVDVGGKFAGKSYTFKWDGTGFKRQGQYLSEDGMVSASDFEKSMRKAMHISDWLQKADDGKPGESLAETSTEELTETHQGLVARLKSRMDPKEAEPLKARHAAIVAELKKRGKDPMGKGMMYKKAEMEAKDKDTDAEKEGEPMEKAPMCKACGKQHDDMEKCGMQKSMLDEWLEKSIPKHEVRMGGPKSDVQGGSQDGGDWTGKGKTPDSNGGPVDAPGQDATGKATGADPGKQEKLSEDDEDQGEIGASDKKKPIEKLGKSELYPMPLTPARQREMVAHEVAKLRKSPEMVTIGPQNHPYGYDQTMGVDTEELSKSDDSADIPSLMRSPGQNLAQSQVLCKSVRPGGCGETHSAMLTACPSCGAGTTRHRIWPNSSEVQVIPVAGPGGLRPAKRDPMIKIS